MREHRRPHTGFQSKKPVDWLQLAVDLGLFAAIFVLPFVMGGRQATGELALTVIACYTTTVWLLRQLIRGETNWRLTFMAPLMLIGISVIALQTVDLSPQQLNQVSPHLEDRLPAWSDDATLGLLGGPWTNISLTPTETERSLVCVIACALLFVVMANRLQTLQDIRMAVRAIGVAASLMALFGIVQYLFGNGRFFWVYDYPFTNTRDYAKGAFTNPNHFASYLAMAVPLLLAWYAVASSTKSSAFRRSRRSAAGIGSLESPFVAVCLVAVAIGILMSQSRGGLLAACGGTIVCLFFLHRVRALNGHTAGAIGGVACAALLSLVLFGDRIVALVEANFHEIASADVSQLDRGNSRQKIWQAAIEGIQDAPILGTGLSSHREVYWSYFNYPDDGNEFSHAENGYLQLTLETGFVGMGIAAACLMLAIIWCLVGIRRSQTPEVGALLAALLAAILINAVHSITDFVWYAPGIMVTLMFLVAAAAGLCRLSRQSESEPSQHHGVWQIGTRAGWGVGLVGVVFLSAWMIDTKTPALAAEQHWFEYVRLVQEEDRLPADADIAQHRREKFAALMNAAKADRHDARIQLRTARALQSLFEIKQRQSDNPMSLLQIQDAALASEWSSHDEMTEWLNRPGVLGENRKYLDAAYRQATHALSLCPLLAEGYLILGELAWMNEPSPKVEEELLVQALTARPFDAEVHYVVGRVLSLRGDEPAALEHWKQSFERSPRFRQQIAELLSQAWEAKRFVEVFNPDTEALTTVVAAYQSSPDVDGHRELTLQLAGGLQEQASTQQYAEAARTWRQAHELYLQLGDAAGADETARAAVEADRNNLQARRALAKWLFSQEDYTAAIEHLQWCHRRDPNDAEVKGWLHAAIAREPQTAAAMDQSNRSLR